MRRFRTFVAFVVLVTYASFGFAAQVQVVSLSGTVTARSATVPERALRQGDLVAEGTRVQTGPNSTAVLRFDDGQVVALKSLTSFSLDNYKYDPATPGAGQMIMSLIAGGLRVVTGAVGSRNRSAFALKTQTATIGIRGTDFLVAISGGDYAQVIEGLIAITTEKGTELVAAGQTVFSAAANVLPATIPPSAAPAGLFNELLTIPLAGTGAGTAAVGAGAGISGTTAAALGLGAAIAIGAAAAAAAGSDDGGGGSTTTHH
jgi:hypothetical protein